MARAAKKKSPKKKPARKKSPPKKKASRKPPSKKKPARKKSQRRKAAPKPVVKLTVDRIQLADLLGVHPDTVSDYSRSGMPVITRGGAGKRSAYDAVECLAWWRERQGKNAKEAAQTRAYLAQANLNELKLAQQKGELLPRDEVIAAGQTYTKAWVAKIRALPRQMVQAGIVAKDREQRIAALLHHLLSEISRWKTVPEEERV